MQNIIEIMKAAGLEIPEDKKVDFDKAVAENYKTIAEVEKINEKHQKELKPLQDKIVTYETTLATFEGVDVPQLKGEIAKLQGEIENINSKQAQEKSDAETAGIINAFYGTLDKKEFINDFTKDSITERIKAGLADPTNKGKGIGEIFTSLTDGKEGIFKNPNAVLDIPPIGNAGTPATFTKEQISKMTAAQINENWDAIKKGEIK